MIRFALSILTILCACLFINESEADNPANQPFAERHLRISGSNPNNVQDILNEFERDGLTKGNPDNPQVRSILNDAAIRPQDLNIHVNFPARQVDLIITAPDIPGPNIDPQKAADQIVQGFVNLYSNLSGDSMRERFESDRAREQGIVQGINELKIKRQAAQSELRQATGAIDVSPASVRDLVESLQKEKESTTIELAAKRARSDVLAEQISKFSGQIQDKIKNDPITAELSKVADLQQQQLDRLNQSKVANSQSVLDQASIAVAEAKTKLLEREETAANAAGGDVVAAWNRDLMNLSVDIAELAARSKALDDRLVAYAKADDYLNNADQWAAQLADLQKQLAPLQDKIRDEEEGYERNHVSIDVIKDSSPPTTQPSK